MFSTFTLKIMSSKIINNTVSIPIRIPPHEIVLPFIFRRQICGWLAVSFVVYRKFYGFADLIFTPIPHFI